MKLTIKPTRRVRGSFRFPPDIALAQRAAVLAVLCGGKSTINNWPEHDSARTVVECIRRLGSAVNVGHQVVQIDGRPSGAETSAALELHCPDAPVAYWLLAGLLAGGKQQSILAGKVPAPVRAAVFESLAVMGISPEISEDDETRIKFNPTQLRGSLIVTNSCLPTVKDVAMPAALFASSATEITEDLPLPDSLERILPAYGIEPSIIRPERPLSRREQLLHPDEALAEREVFHKRLTVTPHAAPLQPVDWVIPGDYELAAPLIAAAAVRPGSEIVITDVGLNSTRTGLLKILRRMGAEITTQKRRIENGEPVGDIEVTGEILKSTKISPSEIPSLAGQLPLIAVAAGSAVGVTVIRGAKELQDVGLLPFAAVTENLRRMGVKVAELEDGWAIEGPTEWHAADIDCHGDSDIGMAFAVAGLSGEKDTIIDNADAVLARFPDFQKILAKLA